MREKLKKITGHSSLGLTLFALLVVMILLANVHKAWAYFTTYTTAKGGYVVSLGDKTDADEDFSQWKKHVSISNSEDSKPVYVRAMAFCGSQYSLNYDESSSKWTKKDDGYYYYSDVLPAGAHTEELVVAIGNIPENVANAPDFNPADFNVIVVYETTPVLYDEKGDPYADWTGQVDATTVTADN